MPGARGSYAEGSVNPDFQQVKIKSNKKSVGAHMVKNVNMESVKNAKMERLDSTRPVPKRADEYKFRN